MNAPCQQRFESACQRVWLHLQPAPMPTKHGPGKGRSRRKHYHLRACPTAVAFFSGKTVYFHWGLGVPHSSLPHPYLKLPLTMIFKATWFSKSSYIRLWNLSPNSDSNFFKLTVFPSLAVRYWLRPHRGYILFLESFQSRIDIHPGPSGC